MQPIDPGTMPTSHNFGRRLRAVLSEAKDLCVFLCATKLFAWPRSLALRTFFRDTTLAP